MTRSRSLHEREKELRALLATPAGREELEATVDRYTKENGKGLSPRASPITFILVHERVKGLIIG
jgi:hypothetical protein